MGRRLGLGLAAVALALGGCKDLGVRGAANTPVDIARTRPAQFWAYQAVTPQTRKAYEGRTGDLFTLGAQRFIIQFPDFAGPTSALAPAGAAGGSSVLAARGARPPFDRLYVATGPSRLQVATEVWQ